MTNKFVKYRFNLIEVVLAIVILSLGMASIFVLFPVGLSNHTDAMAENSIADMAETIISHVRAEAALKSEFDVENFVVNGPEPSTADFNEIGDKWTFRNPETGYYFIRQLSGPQDDPYVDFAAVARVYKDENFDKELFIPNIKDGIVTFDNNSAAVKGVIDQTVLPLIVEISYPADRPYEDRTKVYFRFEVFNEAYKLKKTD